MTSRLIIVRMIGGLGNQLFQLQYATNIQKKLGGTLVLDTSFLKASSKAHESLAVGELIHDFELHQLSWFDLKIRRTLERFFAKVGMQVPCWLKPAYHFEGTSKDLLNMPTLIIDGFWQRASNLDGAFVVKLREKLSSYENRIVSIDRVCVHVRRGDYLTNRHWFVKQQEVAPLAYYQEAFTKFRGNLTNPHFDVYTDDEPWAIQAFKHFEHVSVIPSAALKPFELLAKMASYQNFVIANSTLSWWAAVAARAGAKHVIMPKDWGKGMPSDQYQCDGWVAI